MQRRLLILTNAVDNPTALRCDDAASMRALLAGCYAVTLPAHTHPDDAEKLLDRRRLDAACSVLQDLALKRSAD